MANDLYHLAAVKIGTVVIGQITDGNISDALQEFLAEDSLSVYARAAAIDFEDIRINATSEAVKTVLGQIPLAGKSLAGASNATAYFAKRESGGALAATGVSLKFSLGLAVLKNLEGGGEGQLASVSFELIGVSSDGTSEPFTYNASDAIPSMASGAGEEMYVVGGDGVVGCSVDFGVEVNAKRIGFAHTYCNHASIEKIAPRVSLDVNEIGEFPDHSSMAELSSFQLIDLENGGARGSSPITGTLHQELSFMGEAGGKPGVSKYQAILTYDGTNAPIIFTGI